MWGHSSQTGKWRAAKPKLAGWGRCVRRSGGEFTKVGLTRSRSLGARGPLASPRFLSTLPKRLKSIVPVISLTRARSLGPHFLRLFTLIYAYLRLFTPNEKKCCRPERSRAALQVTNA